MSDLREKNVLYLHQILHHHLLPEDKAEQSAFDKMLILTVCRNAVALNKIISLFLKRKIPNKQALAQTILLTATAEILFMDSPDYAVLNSYVAIAKKNCGKVISGFINAVLRQISLQKEDLKTHFQPAFFTPDFYKLLAKNYDSQTIKKIEQEALRQPPLNITVKKDSSFWAQKLNGKAVNFHTVSLNPSGNIENLEGYQDGQWWVQDIAASLAVNQFSNLQGQRVLDLCAAPGGKSAQLINAGAKVTSLDCSMARLATLKDNLARLHLSAEAIICADVLSYLSNFNQQPFDAILLDAPCSATGVFRRHPELVHLKTVQDVSKQALLQQKILDKIEIALKSGGELIYCVCSIAKDEGEHQIKNFLATHPNFQISPLHNTDDPQTVTSEGFIRTLPFHYQQFGGCDAFFIAKLIKD